MALYLMVAMMMMITATTSMMMFRGCQTTDGAQQGHDDGVVSDGSFMDD